MRGQLMLEFVTLIGVAMLILAIVVSIVISEASKASQNRHESAVREQHERLRSEILAAQLAFEGYTTQIAFTPPYRGVAMRLEIGDGWMRIESDKTTTGSSIPGVEGTVDITTGTITLTKTNESVIAT